jgi:hypothetical protein
VRRAGVGSSATAGDQPQALIDVTQVARGMSNVIVAELVAGMLAAKGIELDIRFPPDDALDA